MNPNGRFQMVETAVQSPGADLVTLSTTGPFIDTGLTINKFNPVFAESNLCRVYLTLDTVREMAQVAGLLDTPKKSSVEKRAYRQGYEDAVKENLNGTLGDVLDSLGFVVDRLGDLRGPAVPVGETTREADTSVDEGQSSSVEVKPRRSTRTTRQGDGASGDKRPARVPNGAVDEGRFRI